MSVQTHLPPYWIERLCALLLIPPCAAVTHVFSTWARAEGGHADWNPLNTTEPIGGASEYNSAGVKNYPTPVAGIAATGTTLALDPYRHLWATMQRAKRDNLNAHEIVFQNRHAFDTWGTGADNVLKLL